MLPPVVVPSPRALLGASYEELLSPEILAVLAVPDNRHLLYELLHPTPAPESGPLLRVLFEHEMAFRALEPPDLEDGYLDDIFWCALLLVQLRDPRDILLLWRARHIDADVGETLGVEPFFGPDVEDSLAHLASLGTEEAREAGEWLADLASGYEPDGWEDWWEAEIAWRTP